MEFYELYLKFRTISDHRRAGWMRHVTTLFIWSHALPGSAVQRDDYHDAISGGSDWGIL